jgi:hypothetical protein
MSASRWVAPQLRRWQPLIRVPVTDEMRELHAREPIEEVWANDEYEAFVMYIGETRDGPLHLSIKRLDRQPVSDWRHKQAIKNEIAGSEREAIELFPRESRLVDAANQTHLWCVGADITLEVGYETRLVGEQDDMLALATSLGYDPKHLAKAIQRPWQDGISTGPNWRP